MLGSVVSLLAPAMLACGSSTKDKTFVEGQDYVVLERLRVMDESGFGQPIAAYSFLVPKGWQSQGGITWKVGETCTSEAIENRVTVRSPDSAYQLGWEVWDLEVPGKPVVRRGTAIAAQQNGYAVHVEVTGLQPGRAYGYRFTLGDHGDEGVTRTAPTRPEIGASSLA